MADSVEVESKHVAPLAECAHCNHMLPPGLGEIECEICGAVCRVSHQPTVDALIAWFHGNDDSDIRNDRSGGSERG